MQNTEIYIGLDVHKETITAAVAEAGRTGEVRQAGTITNDLHALEKLLRRIRGDQGRPLHVCYEAGPCGFVIVRRFKQLAIDCVGVAPSLISKNCQELPLQREETPNTTDTENERKCEADAARLASPRGRYALSRRSNPAMSTRA